MPRAPGWAAAASSPGEVAASLRRAFTEAQVAAYSDWRGHVPDVSLPSYRRTRPAARSRRRCDVYDCREWRLVDDGRWISPKGHVYPETRQVVGRVMAARKAIGLPARPDPVAPHAVVLSMTAQRVESMQTRGRTA